MRVFFRSNHHVLDLSLEMMPDLEYMVDSSFRGIKYTMPQFYFRWRLSFKTPFSSRDLVVVH